jgi:hypothetical protein
MDKSAAALRIRPENDVADRVVSVAAKNARFPRV